MKKLIAILQIFPALLSAVKDAEEAIPDEKQGQTKLELVLGVIEEIFQAGAELGVLGPWPAVATLLTAIISRIVAAFNKSGKFKKSSDASAPVVEAQMVSARFSTVDGFAGQPLLQE